MMQRVLIGVVKGYRLFLSPWLGSACRFEPTCSRYTVEALRKYGLLRGLARGARRILRCNPWNPGGFDPPFYSLSRYEDPAYVAKMAAMTSGQL